MWLPDMGVAKTPDMGMGKCPFAALDINLEKH
jgi:hypothetical protein